MSKFLKRNEIELVVIDWFGVLSPNFYWCRQSKQSKELKTWCDMVFNSPELLNDLMRGKHTITELSQMGVPIKEAFIVEMFMQDMECYRPDFQLLASIQAIFPNAKKVLASDNFSLFDHIVDEYQLEKHFDRLFLSHKFGSLKNDTESLFENILKEYSINTFENCILIDDSQANCAKFRSKSGRTVLVS